ncbi:hypothetical protein HII36_06855 [Nonomuraea sp. NN258]|uniref:hypothetical protein n=1 Tax=Nonomuraea antri TaxID=2730852 RepID=UPI0015682D81|nr:hypothetical protein [Nonomuraea antri]NRQ31562.1 hypothetical protein [Nonomuraea antri]
MRRYRFGWLAAVFAGLHLLVVAVVAVVTVRSPAASSFELLGLLSLLYLSAWLPESLPWVSVAGLVAVGAVRSWMYWQVLRGPTTSPSGRAADPADRRAVWLRRLLYLAVAHDLILWALISGSPRPVFAVVALISGAPLVILFPLALGGVSAGFRTVAITLGLIDVLAGALGWVAGSALTSSWAFELTGLGAVVWWVTVLVGQRRDGRWSRGTLRFGWVALALTVALPVVDVIQDGGMTYALISALNVFNTIWPARSAHELAGPGAPEGRGRRAIAAVVTAVLLLGVVQAEELARITFTGRAGSCPQEGERAFVCQVRQDSDATSPGLLENVPDQRILVAGQVACAVREHERQPLDGWDLSGALHLLCPDVIAAEEADRQRAADRQADQARRSQADQRAELTARCRDPWPRVRAARQDTLALFGDGISYYVFDDRASYEEGEHADVHAAFDDGLVHAEGTSAVVLTDEFSPICLTIKAFTAAPPLRLTGWQRVAEAGVLSRSGRLFVSGEDGEIVSVNLAARGSGRYRLRIYVREMTGPDENGPYEEHLLVAFPGRAEQVIHHLR